MGCNCAKLFYVIGIALFSIIFAIIALAIDILATFKSQGTTWACGWKRFYDLTDPCIKSSYKSADWDKAEKAGEIWMGFGILGILANAVGLGFTIIAMFCHIRLSYYIQCLIYFGACILYIIGIFTYQADTECLDDSEHGDKNATLGASWGMIALCALLMLICAILAFVIKPPKPQPTHKQQVKSKKYQEKNSQKNQGK